MANWRFYAYDVWGRGYDATVNDVFKSDLVLSLSENPNTSEVTAAIKQNIGDNVAVDDSCYTEDVIWLETSVKYTDEDGKYHDNEVEPFGELRKEAG